MSKPRRKKFVRNKANPLILQPRDMELLRDLSEYRFLNTEQILALNPGGKRNMLRRLAAMFDLGFLDKPKTQGNARLRSSHTVYSLDQKGAEVLAKDATEREKILRRIRETRHTSPIIAHALMISQFRVCLTLALKKRSDVQLTRWVQGNDLKEALRRRGETPPLVADAFFVLERQDRKFPCFLEADRATMTQERFVNKLRMYWRHNREEGFRKSLGIVNFRVLTITPNEGRAENLRRAAKDADDTGKGSLMYLFLSETRYNMETPDALLSTEWKSPKDDTPQSVVPVWEGLRY